MGERKVLTKYYPPDFDPSKLPRIKKQKDKENAVRFMLPMSVRCMTCGAFMGQGLKFNARKSNTDEDYLGIKIFRFYMRCKQCPATFAIKTDPKNGDYLCEAGVKRNYEPWRDKQAVEDTAKAEREDADQDAMVALENKTLDAKTEMEELDALDELKTVKSVQARITPDQILTMKKKAETDADDQCENDAETRICNEAALAFARRKATIVQTGAAVSRGVGLASIAAKADDGLVNPKAASDKDTNRKDDSSTKDTAVNGLLDYSSSEGEDMLAMLWKSFEPQIPLTQSGEKWYGCSSLRITVKFYVSPAWPTAKKGYDSSFRESSFCTGS
eukprot:IDg8613t1